MDISDVLSIVIITVLFVGLFIPYIYTFFYITNYIFMLRVNNFTNAQLSIDWVIQASLTQAIIICTILAYAITRKLNAPANR